jgi:hypothetical protein
MGATLCRKKAQKSQEPAPNPQHFGFAPMASPGGQEFFNPLKIVVDKAGSSQNPSAVPPFLTHEPLPPPLAA